MSNSITTPVEAAPPTLRLGDMVGSYRIEGVIADGGMGVVYRATHTILPRRAAVKVLHPGLSNSWAANERMLQEGRVLASIAGPTVVQVFDAGVLADGRPWVAMELVQGETLSDLLSRRGALSAPDVIGILLDLISAVAPAHEKCVVHRDIKPDNIMLVPSLDGRRIVKLIDWGIARVRNATSTRITQVDTTPGTPHYMAPEQIRGHAVDARTDVYAIGVVAFELLTGSPPFRGDNAIDVVVKHLTHKPPSLVERAPGTPPRLAMVIRRMLEKHAERRPSLDEVRHELLRIALGAPDEDDDDLVELEVELEIDVSDLIDECSAVPVEIPDERAVAMARTQPQYHTPKPAPHAPPTPPSTPRARIRWTPPVAVSTGIASAIEKALDLAEAEEHRRGIIAGEVLRH